jgi:hypothetical protein
MTKTRRIKVISGVSVSRADTRIVDAETGEPIGGVQSVKFEHDVHGLPLLTIVVFNPDVEIEGEAEVVTKEESLAKTS